MGALCVGEGVLVMGLDGGVGVGGSRWGRFSRAVVFPECDCCARDFVSQKTHGANSKSRHLATIMDSLLAGIDEWGKALDLCLNTNTSVNIFCSL